jgi:methylthioribose-1-phosphate isomerase
VDACRRIGRLGAALLKRRPRIITICNTGALATVDYGTALGVVRAAHEQGLEPSVLVLETRPRAQGARLTTWELARLNVPFRLLADGAAGRAFQQGLVDVAIAGADRIAANGDTANKIGTYPLALLAREHGVPFYVAAPVSTVDLELANGAAIPIEERPAAEVTTFAPPGTPAWNPAFDVTPASLITSIITELGVLEPNNLAALRPAVTR